MTIEDDVIVNSTAVEDPILDDSSNPEIPEITEEENNQDSDTEDLDLIEELLNLDEDEDETITEPTFFQDKEEEKEEESKIIEPEIAESEENATEEEEFIDEELLTNLDEWFKELENELSETKEHLSQRDKDLEESNTTSSAYSDALDKLGDHPILGPLNAKILRGEKVDIPEYLQKSLEEDLAALPNMEEIASEQSWIQEIKETLQQKLANKVSSRY